MQAIEVYGVERMLTELRELLERGRYRPQAARRVYIPKPGRPKEKRPLSIPRIRDRVLQTAARLVLEPIFEASFLPCSFGFRPKRGAHQALECIRKEVNAEARWVVEIDFKDFYGSLDPDFLMGLVARRISDRRVLRLIRQPAVAAYMPEPDSDTYRAYGLMVLTLDRDAIAEITGFADPTPFPYFGLRTELSSSDD